MEEQKELIIKTALEKFKQFGIRSVSIDDLCRELGMSKKTFYVYFKQKDDLVIEVLRYMHETQHCEIEKYVEGRSALECVRMLIQMPVKFGDVHKEPPFGYDLQKYYPNIYKEHITHIRRTTREFITAHLRQGIAEGVYREDLDVEVCSVFFVMMQQAYIQNINKVHNVSPKRFFIFALDSFLRTVLSEEGGRKVKELRDNQNK